MAQPHPNIAGAEIMSLSGRVELVERPRIRVPAGSRKIPPPQDADPGDLAAVQRALEALAASIRRAATERIA
jgi:hypothetical protein